MLGSVFGRGDGDDEELEKVGEEKVEGWMSESIAEIVWRIGEAPFLVHLFSIDGDGVTVRPAGARVAVELARLRRALNTSMTWLLLVSAVTI